MKSLYTNWFTSVLEQTEGQIIRQLWGMILFIMLWRFWDELSFSALVGTPFIAPRADNFFWLLHLTTWISQIKNSIGLAYILDGLLLLLPIIGICFPGRRLASFLFLPIFYSYFVYYNSVLTHHEHQLVAFLFTCVLLCFRGQRFALLFQGLRYYACFAIASAALWKIGRGSIWEWEQMTEILKVQHLDLLIDESGGGYQDFIYYLVDSPNLTLLFWWGAIALELSFLLGFFTKKYDHYLLMAFLFFFMADYIIMNLFFLEFCIFAYFFLPFKVMEKQYLSFQRTSS